MGMTLNSCDNYPCGVSDANIDRLTGVEPEQKPIDVEVTITQTLSRNTTIQTSDYIATDWLDEELNDDGTVSRYGGTEYDYSECNLLKDYEEQDYTIPDLLNELSAYLTVELNKTPKRGGRYNVLKNMLKACKEWVVDDSEVNREE